MLCCGNVFQTLFQQVSIFLSHEQLFIDVLICIVGDLKSYGYSSSDPFLEEQEVDLGTPVSQVPPA